MEQHVSWSDIAALVCEISSTEGISMAQAQQRALELLDSLTAYAAAWDRWVGTQRAHGQRRQYGAVMGE